MDNINSNNNRNEYFGGAGGGGMRASNNTSAATSSSHHHQRRSQHKPLSEHSIAVVDGTTKTPGNNIGSGSTSTVTAFSASASCESFVSEWSPTPASLSSSSSADNNMSSVGGSYSRINNTTRKSNSVRWMVSVVLVVVMIQTYHIQDIFNIRQLAMHALENLDYDSSSSSSSVSVAPWTNQITDHRQTKEDGGTSDTEKKNIHSEPQPAVNTTTTSSTPSKGQNTAVVVTLEEGKDKNRTGATIVAEVATTNALNEQATTTNDNGNGPHSNDGTSDIHTLKSLTPLPSSSTSNKDLPVIDVKNQKQDDNRTRKDEGSKKPTRSETVLNVTSELGSAANSNKTAQKYSPKNIIESAIVEDPAIAIAIANNASSSPQPPMTSLLPWSNVTTLTFKEGYLYSGFRNQMQVFTVLVMEAMKEGFGQILLESISMKDLHGTNKQVPFQDLWDVEHWNSHYPRLPRLVMSDPIIHDQFNPINKSPYKKTKEGNWTDYYGNVIVGIPTRPVYHGLQRKLMRQYHGYTKGQEPYAMPDGTPNPVDLLILGGALRPHHDLQALVDAKLNSMQNEMGLHLASTTTNATLSSTNMSSNRHPMEYMALHARVEADMQKHVVCRDRKVLNLTDIVSFLEEKFPDPPARALFLPINRKILEKEGYPNEEEPEKTNWIGVNNLQAFNHILEHGLWNGTVKVFQMGTTGLAGTKFENRSSVAGSLLDYSIALESKVFIGTQVSSFSHGLMATRFYRHQFNNWEYLPDGLHQWTPPGIDKVPAFDC
jgi:hypothetical protein